MPRRMMVSAAMSMTFTSMCVCFDPRSPGSYRSYRRRLNYDNRTKTIDDSIGTAAGGSRHRLVEDRASHRPGDQAAGRRTGCGGTRRPKHVHDGEAHPPELSPEALKIQDRIRKSKALLDSDQQRVTELTAALGNAKESQKDALQDELDLAQSQLDLDKDELEEANQDLVEAGGNPQKQIEALEQEHDAQVKARAVTPAAAAAATAAAAAEKHGSWSRFLDWLHLRQKQQQIEDAEASAAQKAEKLAAQRAELATHLESTKGGISELAHHTKSAKTQAAAARSALRAQHTHEDAAALLDQTK